MTKYVARSVLALFLLAMLAYSLYEVYKYPPSILVFVAVGLFIWAVHNV